MMNFDDLAPKWMAGLMTALGLTDYQAAGIIGNLAAESIGFTTLQEIAPVVQGSRGGSGVGQWTGVRRRSFEGWCEKNLLSTASPEGNYGFLLYELTGDYASTVAALKRCVTLETAVFSVGQTYERPLGTTRTHLPGYDSRLSWGRRALAGARGHAALPDDNPIHPTLYRGAKGPAVGELQRRLVALGYDPGPADDDYGLRTEKAVSDFQAARLIVVPGVVGRSTWNELAHAEAERGKT